MARSRSSPPPSREDVFVELFKRLGSIAFATPIMNQVTWAGKARKWVDPSQISAEQQPWLSQFEGTIEDYIWQGSGLGPRRQMGATLFCWFRVNSGDPDEVGSSYLTTILEGIEGTLAPDDWGQSTCTLGGLVEWARIEGKILKIPGDIDPQGLLLVPIRIEIP